MNQVLRRGRVIQRTTSAYRAQANGMIEHLNGVMGRPVVASLEHGDERTWERGLTDFLAGYRGLRHASTKKSPYQMLFAKPMRLPWRFQAMPRGPIPDNLDLEAVENHMVRTMESLRVLQEPARESILKQQVKNMRDFNTRRAVTEHGGANLFKRGDLVRVRNANLRKNKLCQQYLGPYYICRFIGSQRLAVELSMDGKKKIVRSIEHTCPYHTNVRPNKAETSRMGEARLQNRGAYPEEPYTWSVAVPPSIRRMLEELMGETETAGDGAEVEEQLEVDTTLPEDVDPELENPAECVVSLNDGNSDPVQISASSETRPISLAALRR